MEENKEKTQEIENKPTEKATENTIDFSKFSLGSENSQPTTETNIFQQNDTTTKNETNNTNQTTNNNQPQNEQTESKNLIAELNNMTEETTPEIQIENIIIDESSPESKKKQILGSSGIGEKITTKTINTKIEKTMIANMIILISIIAISIMGIYNKYISLASDITNTKNLTFVEKVQDITKTISEYTNINDYAFRSSKNNILTSNDAKNTVKTIIQSKKMNFLHKKDILEKNIPILTQQTIQNAQNLDKTKKEIIKYGFIPAQLYTIIETKQGTSGIKKRISLMENIKFITAFKAFSYMESFVKGLANSINKDPILVENKLNEIIVNGEKDIITYTNTCFLNPYEITSNCNTIGDFETYYKITDTKKTIDTDFLKQLANYVDTKLQETEIPTFSINFLKINPQDDKIEFTIDLNTYLQDEIALSKKGILNPHVFIVTNLINLLKQSLLVIGGDIKTNQIKTNQKIIRVGSTAFNVNNSSIKLSLPIQKNSQREISDFFNSK